MKGKLLPALMNVQSIKSTRSFVHQRYHWRHLNSNEMQRFTLSVLIHCLCYDWLQLKNLHLLKPNIWNSVVKGLDCIKGVVRLVGASQNEDNNDCGPSFHNDPSSQWILKKTTISPLLSTNLQANYILPLWKLKWRWTQKSFLLFFHRNYNVIITSTENCLFN